MMTPDDLNLAAWQSKRQAPTLSTTPPINFQEVIARVSLVYTEGSKQEQYAVTKFINDLNALRRGHVYVEREPSYLVGEHDDASY